MPVGALNIDPPGIACLVLLVLLLIAAIIWAVR
jgi:hypothetical protein